MAARSTALRAAFFSFFGCFLDAFPRKILPLLMQGQYLLVVLTADDQFFLDLPQVGTGGFAGSNSLLKPLLQIGPYIFPGIPGHIL